MEKIAPKNNSFYQELSGGYGTFASPEKQGLIIDKLRLRTMNDIPIKIGIECHKRHFNGVTGSCQKNTRGL